MADVTIHRHVFRFSLGAGRSGRLPLFHLRCKLVVRHRNRVPAFTRIPTPRHQFVFREVLDELSEITVPILLRVLDHTANCPSVRPCQIIGVVGGGRPQFGAPGGMCAPARLWS